jgi:hypothetical protein
MKEKSVKSYDLPYTGPSFEPFAPTTASTDELITNDGVADRGNWSKSSFNY